MKEKSEGQKQFERVERLIELMDTQFDLNLEICKDYQLKDYYIALMVNAFRLGMIFIETVEEFDATDPIEYLIGKIRAIEPSLRQQFEQAKPKLRKTIMESNDKYDEAESAAQARRNKDKGLH